MLNCSEYFPIFIKCAIKPIGSIMHTIKLDSDIFEFIYRYAPTGKVPKSVDGITA